MNKFIIDNLNNSHKILPFFHILLMIVWTISTPISIKTYYNEYINIFIRVITIIFGDELKDINTTTTIKDKIEFIKPFADTFIIYINMFNKKNKNDFIKKNSATNETSAAASAPGEPEATAAPTASPTASPTAAPTAAPTVAPTAAPTAVTDSSYTNNAKEATLNSNDSSNENSNENSNDTPIIPEINEPNDFYNNYYDYPDNNYYDYHDYNTVTTPYINEYDNIRTFVYFITLIIKIIDILSIYSNNINDELELNINEYNKDTLKQHTVNDNIKNINLNTATFALLNFNIPLEFSQSIHIKDTDISFSDCAEAALLNFIKVLICTNTLSFDIIILEKLKANEDLINFFKYYNTQSKLANDDDTGFKGKTARENWIDIVSNKPGIKYNIDGKYELSSSDIDKNSNHKSSSPENGENNIKNLLKILFNGFDDWDYFKKKGALSDIDRNISSNDIYINIKKFSNEYTFKFIARHFEFINNNNNNTTNSNISSKKLNLSNYKNKHKFLKYHYYLLYKYNFTMDYNFISNFKNIYMIYYFKIKNLSNISYIIAEADFLIENVALFIK